MSLNWSSFGYQQPVQWAFRGGVLVVGYMQDARRTADLHTNFPVGPLFDTVDIYYTRSKDVARRHRRYTLSKSYLGLEIDPAQDLLVVWRDPYAAKMACVVLIDLSFPDHQLSTWQNLL